MIKLETTSGIVWINPAHVVWFWDHQEACHVALTGREDMLTLPTMDAEQFASTINGDAYDF